MCFLLCTDCGLLSGWVIFRIGLTLGSQIQSSVLEEAAVLWTLGIWILRNVWTVMKLTMPIFVADVVKSCDTVDRNTADCVSSRLGLLGWFRHVYFEFHSHVFKFAAGIGEAWTRGGGIPQGCPLSMVFIVAVFQPWCKCLEDVRGVKPLLYADNKKMCQQ